MNNTFIKNITKNNSNILYTLKLLFFCFFYLSVNKLNNYIIFWDIQPEQHPRYL